MKEQEGLYFISINTSQEVSDRITAHKMVFAKRFKSKEALKGTPHITLKNPFKFPCKQQEKLFNLFQGQLFSKMEPFEIELQNFGAFFNQHSPVVFVKPAPNLSLYLLQKEIIRNFWLTYPDKINKAFESKFNPHVTIAYRDLDPNQFKEAWNEYRFMKFSATFTVTGFHLSQHDGKKWNIIYTYSFQQANIISDWLWVYNL